jgi:tetratricopeptide (TPR) repeat protein
MLSPAGVSSPVSVSPTATAEGTASPLATSGVAIAQLDEFNKKVSSDVVQGLVQKGNALFQKGDVAGARGAYAEGVALAGRLNVSSNAAEKLVQTFITEEGIQTTECREWVASRLRGKSLQVRMELAIGEMFYRRQEYDKAIEAMQPVADDGGMSAQLAGLIIAMSLSEQGKKAEAMEKLRTIADDPQVSEASAKAQFLIAWMHLQTQEYAQAREAFDKLVRNFPRSPLASKAAGLSKRLAGMGAK